MTQTPFELTRIQPFAISVSDAQITDLQQRLAQTRWPDTLGDPWEYGADLNFLKSLVTYWQDAFDTLGAVRKLNALHQFTTSINDRTVHFIHERSTHPHARPLLMTHGWPGSIVEFQEIIPMLTQPERFGLSTDNPFHVICPSIPGYGFSDAPRQPGFDQRAVAQDHVILMQRLGYEHYGLQGGDWGSAISSWHARLAPNAVMGLHITLIFAPKPKSMPDPFANVSAEEQLRLEQSRVRMKDGSGYQAIQGSKPQTLGYALNDSPVGLAAWITEKFQHWTDPLVPFEQSISKDQLLTNILIYWLSQNITASTRLYYESQHSSANLFAEGPITTPTGHAVFPGELYLPPRAWAEQLYNIQHWELMPYGGHFAALEAPELLTQDLHLFFSRVWPRR